MIKKILFISCFGLTACAVNPANNTSSEATATYHKVSPTANKVYSLNSSEHKTRFLVDGEEVAVGRRVKILMDNHEHTIVAQPEGCIAKEEFVQPPYSSYAPLSFTFMMGECGQETQSNSQVATIAPSTKVTVNATATKTQVIVDTTPPVININIVNTTSRSGVQTTNKEEVIVRGRIHDDSELSSVKLNGEPLLIQNEGFEKTIKLELGLTNLMLVAVDKNNNKATKTIKVQRGNSDTNSTKIKKIALIIGNSQYQYLGALKNPSNDAEDMGNTLNSLGFDVILKLDTTKEQLEDAISEFGKKLETNKGLGIFFYAGHGIQLEGENYAIPINAKIERQKDVKHRAVNIEQVLDEMRYANNGLNVVILDACRDNPLPRSLSRSMTKGLAAVDDAPEGSLIAFATAKGKTASDGTGRNGVFTKHLLLNMRKGTSIQNLFQMTLKGVKEETNNEQIPWLNTSYTGEFKF